MMRHLVIGGSGQVGEHLMRSLQDRGKHVSGTYCRHKRPGMLALDITDPKVVAELLEHLRPEIVYLSASLTNVDYCELNSDEAYAVNVTGLANVVRATNDNDAMLVCFSSDYVFDGLNGPYVETDLARPICEYGRHKLFGEHYIALHAKRFLLIRTTIVYSWESQAKNFIHRLVNRAANGERIRVPMDQVGSPTYAPNLADAVIEMSERGVEGLFHVVGPRLASRYDLALAAARVFDLDSALIEPVSTAELEQPAPRPLKAGMIVDKAQGLLQTRLIDYLEGLTIMASLKDKRESYAG